MTQAASPHCDQRILHAPGECKYCDEFGDWQHYRQAFGIAFTGHPDPKLTPCPADDARPPGSPSDHTRWAGNRPAFAPEFVASELLEQELTWTRVDRLIDWIRGRLR